MIDRVYNEEIKQVVYRVEKKDFMFGLKQDLAEKTWNNVAGESTISCDFDTYENAMKFVKKLANHYSALYIDC